MPNEEKRAEKQIADPFTTADGMTIELTNVLLFCEDGCSEFHVGGIYDCRHIHSHPAFKEFAKDFIGKEITVEPYSYALLGVKTDSRKATAEEMKKLIDDDFPNSPLYDARLYCLDNPTPRGYTVIYDGEDETIGMGEMCQ